MPQTTLLPGLLPPMQPHEYLRLRRLAAGLTIEQAARRHWHRPEQRADVEATGRRWEQPGYAIRADYLIDAIARDFPFDPIVYRQLRDEPADRHPTICRGCGCTAWQACQCRDGADCTIGEDGTCTACEERASRRQPQRRAA